MTLPAGTHLGPYEVVALCGQGGMGDVYRCRDVRLEREVAVKVLPEAFAEDADRLRRFRDEALNASCLNHPNIVHVYDVGAQGSLRFVAMEFVAGRDFASLLADGPMPWEDLRPLALQVLEGLSMAHEAGVVHRDLKPANLMLTERGHVKILDFGLAKRIELDEDLTSQGTLTGSPTAPGVAMGTLGYMSPEQAKGIPADHRSDQFSFGVLVYEMATGERPFRRDSPAESLAALLTADPEPLAELQADLPAGIAEVVMRCLEKSPESRFDTTACLLEAFSASEQVDVAPAAGESPSASEPSIAVLPFSNLSPEAEQEYFCDGLAEELIDALARLPGIKVTARTSTFQFKGGSHDVREIGARLGVRTVLEGSVRKAGDRLRINAQLIQADDGFHLWSEHYDRTMDDVFAIQEEIAQAIVARLQVELVDSPKAPLVKTPRISLDAYRLFLEGRRHWQAVTEKELDHALACLEGAIALEPSFAQAYADISRVHEATGIVGLVRPDVAARKARRSAERALTVDSECADGHVSFALLRFWFDWDWGNAEGAYQTALSLSPGSSDAHIQYAEFLSMRGRAEESLPLARRAVELDPLDVNSSRIFSICLHVAGRLEEAVEVARRALEMRPSAYIVRWNYARSLWCLDRFDEAVALLEAGRADAAGDAATEAHLGVAYAKAGRGGDARAVLEKQLQRSRESTMCFAPAILHTALGDVDEALSWCEAMYSRREPTCVFLRHMPKNQLAPDDAFYSDPRWLDLLQRIEDGGKRPGPDP